MEAETATAGPPVPDRPQLPTPPLGTYAVPDPDDPDVITLWRSTGTSLTPWPPGQRWAPYPPRTSAAMPRPERVAARTRWYASRYWPWKRAVVNAILADPQRAARRFADLVPDGERPAPRVEPLDSRRQEAADRAARADWAARALIAATLISRGWSYSRVASRLGVARSTAWRWARIAAEDADRLQALVLGAALDDAAEGRPD
ncbi:helix-turn-helix domain-containing protein [Streptomyces hydrogenans]|uniref:helix-turn-helix domain-containing protein n=1 Tax=Streptomyces hydrogenans TaxID=1873719 RepID=UPI00381CD3CC